MKIITNIKVTCYTKICIYIPTVGMLLRINCIFTTTLFRIAIDATSWAFGFVRIYCAYSQIFVVRVLETLTPFGAVSSF